MSGAAALGPVQRFWESDRISVILSAVAFVGYSTLWWSSGAISGGGDTDDYRAAARAILHGAEVIPDRVPGYPALLVLTGAVDAPSRLLLLVQVAMAVASVLMVVACARMLDVGERLRVAATVVLLAPPMMAHARFVLTEVFAGFLVMVAMWSFTRWATARHSNGLLVLTGLAVGFSAWVRPAFTAWFAVTGLVVWGAARSLHDGQVGGRRALRQGVLAGGVALGMVVLLVGSNIIRFGYPSTTPLFGWNLSTRTASFVERLEGDDAVRGVLVDARNQSLISGESHTGLIYIWSARPQMDEVTGRSGRDLDQYMLALNLKLIAANPASYVAAVTGAAGSYILLGAPSEADFGVRPLKLVWMAIHFALALVFVAQACVVAGLVALRRVSAVVLWPLVFGYALLLYNLAISTMFEVGISRHRVPTDAVAILVLTVGVSLWAKARQEIQSNASAGPRDHGVEPAYVTHPDS